MRYTDIYLDNRSLCTFIDGDNVENVIFCRPLEENLQNAAAFEIRDNEFIHSFITESTGSNMLVTNIKLQDGSIHENVQFKIVECLDDELPFSTIYIKKLNQPEVFELLYEQAY